MSGITALKKKLEQLDKEKSDLLTKISSTSRKNSDARKYALGGALLKLATTDPAAHRVLKMVFQIAQEARPKAFEEFELPEVPAVLPKQGPVPAAPPVQSH